MTGVAKEGMRLVRPILIHLVFGAARGGVERDVLAMVAETPNIEHIVAVFGETGPMVEDWRRAGASIEVLGSESGTVFSIVKHLKSMLQKHRPDGVIAWFGLVNLPQIIHVCNRAKVKLIVHAGNPAHTMSIWTNLRYWCMSKWWPAAGPLPMYACCSDYVSKSFDSSLYLRQFPRTTIYNGIEMPTDPIHTPRAYDPDQPFVIGMTARLNRIKDHETLIRAFAFVVERYPNARLELAGDGEMRAGLESLVKDLSIADKVSFLGDVGNVYSVMRRWGLFAYATTEREGLGNALSEAMALGLPCVVTDVGPMREFGGEAGAVKLLASQNVVAIAEEIGRLMVDQAMRSQLSRAGREFSTRRFSPSAFGKSYLDLFRFPGASVKHRILHHVFGAARGGVEGNTRAMISALPAFEHIVLVFGEAGPMVEDWRRAGAQVEILGPQSSGAFTIGRRLREGLKKHRPDGVIAWFGLVNLPQIIRACNQAGVKLVVHAGNPAHTMSIWTNLRYWCMSKWWPAAGPLPMYACCSDYVSRSFDSSLYLRRFPRTTIYNGIEMPTDPIHTPRAYDPDRPFVIGMTARLSRIKDHETLIRAFAFVVERFPNARLELAGDGEMRAGLESLVKDLSIADKVSFLGDVGNVYSVMRRWDLFAYATTEREGLGNALSEAMALGLPCVVTDVGPMREFKGQGEAICFVGAHHPELLAASICGLIPDLNMRLQMSSDGRALSKRRFASDAFANQYASLAVASIST